MTVFGIVQNFLEARDRRAQGVPVACLHLDTEGVLNAAGPSGSASIYYDAAEPMGRWVVAVPEAAALPRVVSTHLSLDETLDALAALVGFDRNFNLLLPCGSLIQRPGKVDAARILAGMGYVVAKGITAYAAVTTTAGARKSSVVRLLNRGLAGTSFGLGTVDLVERDEARAFWCCDISLPFEGLLHRSAAEARVRGEFEAVEVQGAAMELHDCFELVSASHSVPHVAELIEMLPSLVMAA